MELESPQPIVEKDSNEEKSKEFGTSETPKSLSLTIEEDLKDAEKKHEDDLRASFKASLKQTLSKNHNSIISKVSGVNNRVSQGDIKDIRVDDL